MSFVNLIGINNTRLLFKYSRFIDTRTQKVEEIVERWYLQRHKDRSDILKTERYKL